MIAHVTPIAGPVVPADVGTIATRYLCGPAVELARAAVGELHV